MRLVFISICFLFSSLTYSQKSYKDLIGDADKFYRDKEYVKSVEVYKQAFKIEKKMAAIYTMRHVLQPLLVIKKWHSNG